MQDFPIDTGVKNRGGKRNVTKPSGRSSSSKPRRAGTNQSNGSGGIKTCIFIILGCVLLNTFLACLNEYRVQKMAHEVRKAAEQMKSDLKEFERATESLR